MAARGERRKTKTKAKGGRKAAKPAPPARAAKPRPRQAELPGTEDRAIKPLEDAAQAYAEIRDERMELNQNESSLKQSLIRLMKRHGKTHYKRNGISIDLITEAETVRVRFKKEGDPDADLPPGEGDEGGDEPEPRPDDEGDGAEAGD